MESLRVVDKDVGLKREPVCWKLTGVCNWRHRRIVVTSLIDSSESTRCSRLTIVVKQDLMDTEALYSSSSLWLKISWMNFSELPVVRVRRLYCGVISSTFLMRFRAA